MSQTWPCPTPPSSPPAGGEVDQRHRGLVALRRCAAARGFALCRAVSVFPPVPAASTPGFWYRALSVGSFQGLARQPSKPGQLNRQSITSPVHTNPTPRTRPKPQHTHPETPQRPNRRHKAPRRRARRGRGVCGRSRRRPGRDWGRPSQLCLCQALLTCASARGCLTQGA